ncbi:MAG: zf-HC2 domain-containing protein [Actinomycetota bacterium]
MTTDDITCREVVELLTDYLDGAIPAPDRSRLDAHLARCDGCAAALEQLREAIRVTGTLTEEQVAQDALEPIRGVFRAWRSETGG